MAKQDVLYLGVDIGNGYVKTSVKNPYTEGNVIFKSKVEIGTRNEFETEDIYNVVMNDKLYKVGDGVLKIDIEKIHDDNYYKVLLATAIASSFPEKNNINVYLGVGLPVSYWGTYKDIYTEKILEYDTIEIDVNNKYIHDTYNINILGCITMPQGYIFNKITDGFDEMNIIVVDIGHGTTDIVYWEEGSIRSIQPISYPVGLKDIYNDYLKVINNMLNTQYTDVNIDNFFKKDRVKDSKGKFYDVKEIKANIIANRANQLINYITNAFNPASADVIYMIGGGSSLFYPHFANAFGEETVRLDENPQFANAEMFEIAARAKLK